METSASESASVHSLLTKHGLTVLPGKAGNQAAGLTKTNPLTAVTEQLHLSMGHARPAEPTLFPDPLQTGAPVLRPGHCLPS